MTKSETIERTTIGERVAATALTLVVIGGGHVLRGRPWRGVAWLAAVMIASVLTPWLGVASMVAVMAIRLVAAPLDAAVVRSGPRLPAGKVLIACAAMLGFVIAGAIAVRVLLVETFRVPSAGMAPTMAIGDFFVVDKTDADPEVGDVIVFRRPGATHVDFIKRVVAVGGDRVAVRAGVLYRNGAPVPQRRLDRPCTYDDRDGRGGTWERVDGPCAEESLGGHTYRVMIGDAPEPMLDFPASGDELERRPRFPGDEGTDGAYVVPRGHVFTMGDNRIDSHDSRFWGPVPLDHVKGTAMFVWLSLGPRTRWDRVGHTIE